MDVTNVEQATIAERAGVNVERLSGH
jgi:pyridoxal biosynthesis lyase PdxS